MPLSVNVALIMGPSYDSLYERLDGFTAQTGIEVNVRFTGDHPALNAHLAGCDPARYDLVSTHSKYAPSQLDVLAPLDTVIDADTLEDFVPQSIQLSRIDGMLYGLPRLIDVRLLHYRTDLISEPPRTWNELLRTAQSVTDAHDCFGFAFPGRESGLFGTFYELVEMGGGHLFPASLIPDITNEGGAWALDLLRTLYTENLVPPETPQWHFDEVHRAFRDGRVAMVGDWPGFYALHADPNVSRVADRFAVCPYPSGPSGRALAYGGEHTFALTTHGIERDAAVQLLAFLTAPEQQLAEARRGAVPPRRSVMHRVQSEASGDAQERWTALEKVLQNQMLIPPKLAYYPHIEDVIWTTVQECITGERGIPDTLKQITQQVEMIVDAHSSG